MLCWTEPRNHLELEFAEQIIRASWKLKRLPQAEQVLYSDRMKTLRSRHPHLAIGTDYVLVKMLWDDRGFTGFGRYERQLSNTMNRAMDQLRKLRKDEQHGILNDFAADRIAQKRAVIENEQNEQKA